MTALVDQQRSLQRAIVDAIGAEAAGVPSAAALLRAPGGREPLLQIYRHAYTARLAGALRDNFGVLPQVLGDVAFEALAIGYVQTHPSQRPSIRWFGDRLPEFMATREDLVPHPAIVDLARMEWALRSAFDAADAQAIGVDALQDVPPDAWPRLVFEPLPSVRRVELEWNVEPVWRALQDAAADVSPDMPEPEPLEHTLLVWRRALETRWRSLDELAARLLGGAVSGQPFGALCAEAAAGVGQEHAAQHAAGALRLWLDDGLFSGWHLAPA